VAALDPKHQRRRRTFWKTPLAYWKPRGTACAVAWQALHRLHEEMEQVNLRLQAKYKKDFD